MHMFIDLGWTFMDFKCLFVYFSGFMDLTGVLFVHDDKSEMTLIKYYVYI